MPKIKILLVPILAVVITTLASCDLVAGEALPTPYPTEHMPTVIAMTVTAQGIVVPAANPEAALSGTPTLPVSTPESTPTSTPPPTPIPATTTPTAIIPTPTQLVANSAAPDNIPESSVQILNPGPASKVVSPFSLRAAVKAGPESVIRIELLGEDGRLLMREVRSYNNSNNEWYTLGSEVNFGIAGAAESARLQIGVEDEHGRLKSLSSVELFLLASGSQDLNQPLDQLEDIVIESPRSQTLIQGEMMRVAGLTRLRSSQPLLIEISTSDGRIVGTRQVSVTPSPGSSYGPFEIDVPFNVDFTTRVRVQIWEPGDIIPGIVNLSSLEVILSP